MRLHVFFAAVVVVMVAGCSQPAGSTATSPTGPAASVTASATPPLAEATGRAEVMLPQGSESPAACDPGEFADSRGICLPCQDYEGCFTSATDMSYFYNVGIGLIENYSQDAFGKRLDPDKWWYVQTGVTGQEPCTKAGGGLATYTDRSYEYCPVDRAVYVGEQSMWAYYSTQGDAAPIVGLAHEWGHHLQELAGIRTRSASRSADTLAQEIQADCVAGAWAGWARTNQVLNESDDLADIAALMKAVADYGPERQHGDLTERVQAFDNGLANGIVACNAYVDWTPLVTDAGPVSVLP